MEEGVLDFGLVCLGFVEASGGGGGEGEEKGERY